MTLDIRTILRILPHRPPYLMIDRVIDLQPRKSARAIKAVTYNEPFFDGTNRNAIQLPPTLFVEAMFQLACVLAYASDALDPSYQVFAFAGIDRAKFRHAAEPGDLLTISISLVQQRNNVWKCDGTAEIGDTACAEAQLLAAIQDVQPG